MNNHFIEVPGKEFDEQNGKAKINRTDILIADAQKNHIINIKIDKSQENYLLTLPSTQEL